MQEFVQKKQITPQPQQRSKDCRICLANEIQENFIIPCNCIGSVKYVHEPCIRQWSKNMLKKKLQIAEARQIQQVQENQGSSENNSELLLQIFCQLCHSKLFYQYENKLKFRQFHETKTKIVKKKVMFSFLIFLLALSVTGIVLLSFFYSNRNDSQFFASSDKNWVWWIVLAILIISIIVFLVCMYELFLYFCKFSIQITKILQNPTLNIKKQQQQPLESAMTIHKLTNTNQDLLQVRQQNQQLKLIKKDKEDNQV